MLVIGCQNTTSASAVNTTNYNDLYNSFYEQAVIKEFKKSFVKGSSETQENIDSALNISTKLAEAADEAKEKVQRIISDNKNIDIFTKSEDIEKKQNEEKIAAEENKTDVKNEQKVFEEYIRLFMPDAITPDAKTIEREIAAIKDQANCLQLYTVSNAAALSILPSIKNQIDDVKAKINEYNIKEEAKTKNDNADSIINNKNKEAKINANADWTENKLRNNIFDIKENEEKAEV